MEWCETPFSKGLERFRVRWEYSLRSESPSKADSGNLMLAGGVKADVRRAITFYKFSSFLWVAWFLVHHSYKIISHSVFIKCFRIVRHLSSSSSTFLQSASCPLSILHSMLNLLISRHPPVLIFLLRSKSYSLPAFHQSIINDCLDNIRVLWKNQHQDWSYSWMTSSSRSSGVRSPDSFDSIDLRSERRLGWLATVLLWRV